VPPTPQAGRMEYEWSEWPAMYALVSSPERTQLALAPVISAARGVP